MAVVISRTNLNEDVFEGWVMLVAAFFVITMVVFMMKTGRKMKGEIEGKVGLLRGQRRVVRTVRFHFSDGAARGRGDGSDSLRGFAELDRADEFSGHASGGDARRLRSA